MPKIVAVTAMVLITAFVVPNANAATSAATLQDAIDHQLAAYPGGTQTAPNAVSYNGGSVVVVFPQPGSAIAGPAAQSAAALVADVHGCPAGAADNRWYCLYADINWGGRRLQWNLPHCTSSSWIKLGDYGFANQTSSWVNTGALTVYVDNFANGSFYTLWTEIPNASASWVGSANNDKADQLRAC